MEPTRPLSLLASAPGTPPRHFDPGVVAKVEHGRSSAAPAKVSPFGEMGSAHRLIDEGEAGGKLVVSLTA